MTLENRVSDLERRADEWGARLAATLNALLDSLDEDGAAYRCYLAAKSDPPRSESQSKTQERG